MIRLRTRTLCIATALLVTACGADEGARHDASVEPDTTASTTAAPDSATSVDGTADTSVPDADDDTSAPDSDEDTIAPDSDDDTIAPDSDDDTTEPDAEDDTTEPDADDDTAAPDAEDDTTVPDADDDTAAPDADDTLIADDDTLVAADDTLEPDAQDDTLVAADDTLEPDTGGDTLVPDADDDTRVADDTLTLDSDDDDSNTNDTDDDETSTPIEDTTATDVADDDATSLVDAALPDTSVDDVGDDLVDAPDTDDLADVDDAPADTTLVDVVAPAPCQVGQEHPGGASLVLVDAFPELTTFAAPIDLTHANDGSGRVFVLERAGRLVVVGGPPGARVKRTSLDIRDRVHTGVECGLLGVALHPAHADNGLLFTTHCERDEGQTSLYLTRWRVDHDDPDVVDEGSEEIVLEQPQPADNHNGGALAFGPDGYLYVALGDGGGANDPQNNGQNPTTWLGKILRIDVDPPTDEGDDDDEPPPYRVPPDNPFVGTGARPEICALGLRNPWRMSFDRVGGELWVGDVGQGAWEEIDIVRCGKNYGWRVMEGAHCRPGGPPTCTTAGLEPPVLEYPHAGSGVITGFSVTGGFVYRGSSAPSHYGRYIFSDYVSRAVVSWARGEPTPAAADLVAPAGIASFGEDELGELHLLALGTGRIYRLEERPAPGTPTPPATLSATGCFTALDPLTPAAGVLPYALNTPFWSDGADKLRWLVPPGPGSVTFATDDKWTLQPGTVLIKHFTRADPLSGAPRRIETRFLVKQPAGVRGWSYRWRADQSDADLVMDGADVELPDGEASTFFWSVPSAGQCATCHRAGASEGGDGVLGLTTRQLDRQVVDPTGASAEQVDQIAAWADLGLFDGPLPDVASWPPPHPTVAGAPSARGVPDAEAPLEVRAAAWLDTNCAFCHAPGGPLELPFDLRAETPLALAGHCDAPPTRGDLGVADAALLAPGDPLRSILYLRVAAEPPQRMPPLATRLHNAGGEALLRTWIASLLACP